MKIGLRKLITKGNITGDAHVARGFGRHDELTRRQSSEDAVGVAGKQFGSGKEEACMVL